MKNTAEKILKCSLLLFITLISVFTFLNSNISHENDESTNLIAPQTQSWLDDPLPTYFYSPIGTIVFESNGDMVDWDIHYFRENDECLMGNGLASDLYELKLLKIEKAYNFSFAKGGYYSTANPYTEYGSDHHNFTFSNNDYTMVVPEFKNIGGISGVNLNNFHLTGTTDGFLLPNAVRFIQYASGLGAGVGAGINLSLSYVDLITPSTALIHIKSATNGTNVIINSAESDRTIFYTHYSLDTTLVLNSTYYSRTNTKTYFFTNGERYDANFDYLRWVESTDTIFQLKSPWYKLRITDLENNILYEDLTFQEYSRFRFLDLDSMRVQNNADEPILTSLYESNGHYEAAESFNMDQINTFPANSHFNYISGTAYVVDEHDDHSRVLNISQISDLTQLNYQFDENVSDIEFWLNVDAMTVEDSVFGIIFGDRYFDLDIEDGHDEEHYTSGLVIQADTLIVYRADDFISTTYIHNVWNHFRIHFDYTTNLQSWYLNDVCIVNNELFYNSQIVQCSYLTFLTSPTPEETLGIYLDALDFSGSSGYYQNRNLRLNTSIALQTQLATEANYNRSGWYQGAISFDNNSINQFPSEYTNYNPTVFTTYVAKNKTTHSRVLAFHQNPASNGYLESIKIPISITENAFELEFWHFREDITGTNGYFAVYMNDVMLARFGASGRFYTNLSTNYVSINTFVTGNYWHHFRFSIHDSTISMFVNNTLIGTYESTINPTLITSVGFGCYEGTSGTFYSFVDGIDYSGSSGFFINRNTLLNYSTDLNTIIASYNYNHSGHYQAAESFDNAILNVKPSYYTGTDQLYVTNEKMGHKKVLAYGNYSAWGSATNNAFHFDLASGNVEFYALASQTDKSLYFGLKPTGLVGPLLQFSEAGILKVFNDTTATILFPYQANVWYHFRFKFDCSTNSFTLYINGTNWGVFGYYYDGLGNLQTLTLYNNNAQMNSAFYFDAFDWSSNSGYFINRNCLENNSIALEYWNTYPNWQSGYYQGSESWDYNEINTWLKTNNTDYQLIFRNTAVGRNSVVELNDTIADANKPVIVKILPLAYTTGTYEFSFYHNSTVGGIFHFDAYQESPWANFIEFYSYANKLYIANWTGSTYAHNSVDCQLDVWHNIRVVYNCTNASYQIFIDNNSTALTAIRQNAVTNIRRFYFGGWASSKLLGYLDSFDYYGSSNYFINRIQLENTTHAMLAMNYTAAQLVQPTFTSASSPILTLQTNPYSSTLSNFTSNFYLYRHFDLYANELESGTMFANQSELIYTPPNTRENFISIHDTQANYLNWEQFRIKINGTLIYENRFYREIGTSWNISLYNQYDLYLTSTLHTVDRDENYIPLQVVKRSLKIYNQQEQFLHVNITYDPNYYSLPFSWSGWLAPKESVEYFLIQDYYRVGITNFENGSAIQYFAYNLLSDDILMISSSNTLYNVLANIANVNTTIGTQFTYVALNFTNTNSAIGNQTILLNINFGNYNTTLGQMLLSQQNSFAYYNSSFNTLFINQANNFSMFQTNLTNIYLLANNNFNVINDSLDLIYIMNQNSFNAMNTSIDELIAMGVNSFYFTNGSLNQIIAQNQNSFTFLNSSVDEIKILNQNSFSFLNTSISNLYAMSEDSFVFMNSSVAALTTQSLNSFEFLNSSVSSIYALSISSFQALNSSFDDLNFNMLQNFTFSNSLINSNQLQLMTQFSFVESNITQLGIDIDSRLLTLNSTIANLTAQLSNYIILVNNSIYTAILDSTAVLEMQGNNIYGTLNQTFVQNEYLTKILQETMFSSMLNWTNVNYNYSIIESQIDDFHFVNSYENDTIEYVLRYQNEMQSLIIAAQNSADQKLPNSDVEYRVKSLTTGQYLTDWIDLSNKTVDYGFYTEELQPDLNTDTNDWILTVLIFSIVCIALGVIIVYQRNANARKQIKRSYANENRLDLFK